ncbi:MAG: hypothetical protein CME06_14705 [Gemmatimonadetes bacterium]|nr:hypothetical protein [Gemmatimonadota bacterium]
MCRRAPIAASLLSSIVWSTAEPATIHVPDDYAQIQAAIDAASDGDEVVVAPGTYFESEVGFRDKSIVVRGSDPADPDVVDATVVDADSMGSVFRFESEDDSTAGLIGLTVTGGKSWTGGGVYVGPRASILLDRLRIAGNWATGVDTSSRTGRGGGIACGELSRPRILACRIEDNVAGASRNKGGGLWCDSWCAAVIEETVFRGNTAKSGGGAYCERSSAPIFVRCLFEGSRGTSTGGGVYLESGYQSSALFEECRFVDNDAIHGGGVYSPWGVGQGTYRFSNCLFQSNTAARGGGAYTEGWTTMAFENSTFRANGALGAPRVAGGGLYSEGFATITNCVFDSNSATGWRGMGGGVCSEQGDIHATATLFTGNWASGSDTSAGGAAFCSAGTLKLFNCTLVGNAATGSDTGSGSGRGGAVYGNVAWDLDIRNSILWGNEPEEVYGDYPEVSYSDVEGGWPGVGNIDADPGFSPRWPEHPLARFLLGIHSPCIDSADPTMTDPPWWRISPAYAEHNSRQADMGAYGGDSAVGWIGGASQPTSH